MSLGERLAASRTRVGLSQDQLAHSLGKDRTLISHVEAGRAGLLVNGLVRAAQVLDVSADYLIGLTDDPAPVDDRVLQEARKCEELEAELRQTQAERDRLRTQVAAAGKSLPHSPLQIVPGGLADDEAREHPRLRMVPELDVEAAAGTGAYVEQEPIIGHLAFREEWLARTCVDPEQCRSIRVRGRSMEPTLQAGARILVDPQRTRRLRDKIYVVRTEDGVVVKRLARDGDDWLLVSDNEDQETYPAVPWPEDAIVRGEVMWSGQSMRRSW